MGWHTRAACREADPDLFFVPGEDYTAPAALAQVAAARRVCLTCPVRIECLSWAVEVSEDHGLWAGMTPDERRTIRRDRLAGVPDPELDAEPMCPACSLLFPMPAVDGQLCERCLDERTAA